MKRLATLIIACAASLAAFCSCEINIGTSHETSIDAYLTVYYAGGLPSLTAQGRYELRSEYLSDREIEDMFYELSRSMQPGFTNAVLEIEFFDWMDHLKYVRIFDFWWEYYNDGTGDGYYAWQEQRK